MIRHDTTQHNTMEDWSSRNVSVHFLIVKLEETVKKMKSVSGKKAISDCLLAWFSSAYNQLEARTNEVFSKLNKLPLPYIPAPMWNVGFIAISSPSNNNSNSISKPGPTEDTQSHGRRRTRSPSLDDTSEHEHRDKRLKLKEGWSSGVDRLDDLIERVEELVKKLKGVDGKKDSVNGPLLASFMSAFTQLENWTDQLLSASTVNEPSSPSKPSASNNSDPNIEVGPDTPENSRGKKTSGSNSPDNRSEEKRETKIKAQTDQNSGSSLTAPLDDLIARMKEMVNMLKSEGRLVNSPLLGCFVSAQTLLMACATELLSISIGKSKALHHQGSEISVNYSSTTTNDTAADGYGEKK
ncbi:hypothetical protein IC582_029543 [Cucumis melo]